MSTMSPAPLMVLPNDALPLDEDLLAYARGFIFEMGLWVFLDPEEGYAAPAGHLQIGERADQTTNVYEAVTICRVLNKGLTLGQIERLRRQWRVFFQSKVTRIEYHPCSDFLTIHDIQVS